jgi:serine/threonine protein kinase/tetratricopeptide (TPR) repeat protein
LGADPENAIELIYEEMCLRQEYGESVTREDFFRRFPQWQAQLQILFECHQLLETTAPVTQFPKVGETVAEFQLRLELGQGASGRVFLATQPSLAHRAVVLKLTLAQGREHLSLARLQHTNISPLYAVYDDPARNLRALCMPYFGGATLAQVLHALGTRPRGPLSGKDFLQALSEAQPVVPGLAIAVDGPTCRFYSQASYVRTICWIGACLADALDYARERSLVHLDLKPSNILIAADGQPMLLDFHLARSPIHADGPVPEWLGGTPAYMAPEQQRALEAIRLGRKVPASVDGRADIYSLGLALYEALAGVLPGTPAPPLHRCNSKVSTGLSDIVGKCLHPDPAKRYATAAALASDLRCHLADLPLRSIPNRSWMERWSKMRRRRPMAHWVAALVAVVGITFSVGAVRVWQDIASADTAFMQGQMLLQKGHFDEAEIELRHGYAVADGIPVFGRDRVKKLADAMRKVQCGKLAEDLHRFADSLRYRFASDITSTDDLRVLQSYCGQFWDKRELILRLEPELTPVLARQVKSDLLDLAILWADLRLRLAKPGDARARHQEALAVLAEAEAAFGASRVLCLEKQVHAAGLGLTVDAQAMAQQAEELVPQTAWEHYALARFHLQGNHPDRALAELNEAIRLQSDNLWPYFYKGRCALQLGNYSEAVAAFTACVVLKKNEWNYYYLGQAYTALDDLDSALDDYENATKCEPNLSHAWVNAGIIYYRKKDFAKARERLERALGPAADRATAAIAYYNLALVDLAEKNPQAAGKHARLALSENPKHADARRLAESLPKP